VVGIPGADTAAGRVIAALGADGAQLVATGKAVRQAAYTVQRSQWSKAEVPARDQRLAQARVSSTTPITGEMTDTLMLQQATSGGIPIGPAATAAPPPYTNLAVRSLSLAALAALGEARDEQVDRILQLMIDPEGDICLGMSKLNLYQCLAVSKPHYEDIFCLGQHAIADTGACLVRRVGAPPPIDVSPAPLEIAETQAAAQPVAAAKMSPAPAATPR
jgi:hypothetical protein